MLRDRISDLITLLLHSVGEIVSGVFWHGGLCVDQGVVAAVKLREGSFT